MRKGAQPTGSLGRSDSEETAREIDCPVGKIVARDETGASVFDGSRDLLGKEKMALVASSLSRVISRPRLVSSTLAKTLLSKMPPRRDERASEPRSVRTATRAEIDPDHRPVAPASNKI